MSCGIAAQGRILLLLAGRKIRIEIEKKPGDPIISLVNVHGLFYTLPPRGRARLFTRGHRLLSDTGDDGQFGFAWDIGYALSREGLTRGKRKLNLQECRAIGARVLEHLRLSQVELTRKPFSTPRRYPGSE
jgi:hypothetical protein